MATPYYLGNQSSRQRPPSRSDQDPGDRIREQKLVARRTTEGDRKAQLVNGLMQQRAKLIAAGAMEHALPVINANASEADLVQIQSNLNALSPETSGGMIPQNDRTAAGQVVTNQQQGNGFSAPVQVMEPPNQQLQPADMTLGEQARIAAATAPGMMGLAAASLPGQQAPETAAAPAPGNPMLDAMTRDGTLPQGARLDHSGAGYSTDVRTSRGIRNVAIQPTGTQALSAQFPGWEQMTPEQRAAVLPRGVGGGEVTDTGRTQPNYRGERAVQETTGNGIEVNPREDRLQTFTPGGDMVIDPRYRVEGASALGSVTRGGATGSHFIGDETGDRTAEFAQKQPQTPVAPKMRATPPTLAPEPAAAPAAPAAPPKPTDAGFPLPSHGQPIPRNMTQAQPSALDRIGADMDAAAPQGPYAMGAAGISSLARNVIPKIGGAIVSGITGGAKPAPAPAQPAVPPPAVPASPLNQLVQQPANRATTPAPAAVAAAPQRPPKTPPPVTPRPQPIAQRRPEEDAAFTGF